MGFSHVIELALVLPLAACAASATQTPRTTASASEAARASEPFRQDHQHLIQRLEAVREISATLADAPEAERAEKVHEVVHFFKATLAPHAEVEEAVLYPYVDRVVAAPSPYRYTDTMRHDHQVVGRTIDELYAFMQAGDMSADALRQFQQKALGLVGLVRAHFESEEDVLLATLDRRITREAFVRDVMEPSHEWMREHGQAEEQHG